MNTLQYLKQYAYYYLYAIAIVLSVSAAVNHTAAQVSTRIQQRTQPVVLIDPGHGGIDGGTTSCTGLSESKLNLEISLRLNDLLRFLGHNTLMTRTQDISLGTQGSTIREQKSSDLKKRVEIANQQQNAVVISVHQNHFTQSKYSGPQVFYNNNPQSQNFAEQLQKDLNHSLAPDSNRSCKRSNGVYLMEHIHPPGILVECGFLSNPEEEQKLRKPEYQKKLCCIIAAATVKYLEASAVN